MEIKDIEFILSHFEEPSLFPRKMMTLKSNGQFSITSSKEIFEKCEQADFTDCRINAYPEYTAYKGIVIYPPNFIFIDLDLANFSKYTDPKKMIDNALEKTLKKISDNSNQNHQLPAQSESFNHNNNNTLANQNDRKQKQQKNHIIKPNCSTVLWTGNGYHIYLPIQAIVLDTYEPFSKDKFPNLFSNYNYKYYNYSVSELFLKFAEQYFTDRKADPQHSPKYKTCLIRIPNTYNSKCLSKGLNSEESKVKIVREWNGYRLPIQLLTKYFMRWLVQENIDQRSIVKKRINFQYNNNNNSSDNFQIRWIENLLQKGIADGRKESLRLILGPYLSKRKNHDEAFIILQKWLDKCNIVRPLDRNLNSKQRIESSLKNSKGFLVLENLKTKNKWLYDSIST